MYKVSLGEITLPVAPSKITMKVKNNNKTMELIDGREINFLRTPGLKEFSFEFLIPHIRYPFAEYPDGFMTAQQYIEALELMKMKKEPFTFQVQRILPSGKELLKTSERVSLEDYTITEDTGNGLDFMASVTLKQYKEHKSVNTPMVQVTQDAVIVKEEKQRDSKKDTPSTYTVKKGDSLWKICKSQLGDGAKYKEIAELNGISNPNLIYPGQVIKLGTT
ncbi:LysM peptidoglycan-binding domain-containing protein [Anaerotignum sp. MB30-C6]|uniref:LysM peptidoglycan-binding domain-containing protein n=1 Tax=Anaerotignum sp. MB30-C6 TaxID=3070814 RepID=UPI0027DB5F14|nr:LysM peptidoglycan-binding domain-containing protein [Anaerotignum sp. MB30-C6]WMI82032.1 LysM peptidoglycan-binding domain-containing protein [Anaerotignum sp. MB30-C6]